MTIRKFWRKLVLVSTAIFWANCSEDNGVESVYKPVESNASTAVGDESSAEENGAVSSSSEPLSVESSTDVSSSSESAPVDTIASSSSAEIKYGYKVYSDTTIRCKRTTYTKFQISNNIYQNVSYDGYICNNGDTVFINTYHAKDGLLYTAKEYDLLFGPCAEHGGTAESYSVDPKCTGCTSSDADSTLVDLYYGLLESHYEEFSSNTSAYSSEKKECFYNFYEDVAPICLYGTFSSSNYSSTKTITVVGKDICADGTVLNEEAYNEARASRDSILAYYEQIYQNSLYCKNFDYASRLDSCNAIDTTGTKIEGVSLDTTKVDKEYLEDPEAMCD